MKSKLQAIALDVVKPQTPEFEVTEFDGRTLPLEDKSVDCFLTQEPRNPDDFANSEIM